MFVRKWVHKSLKTLTKFEEALSDPSFFPALKEMDTFLTNTYKGLESAVDIKNAVPLAQIYERAKGKAFHINDAQPTRSLTKPLLSSETNTPSDTTKEKSNHIYKFCQSNHTLIVFETLYVAVGTTLYYINQTQM